MPKKSRDARTNRTPSRASVSDVLAAPILTPPAPRPLPADKAREIYTKGILEAGVIGFVFPQPINDVTLSGATMSDAGAWLEVGGDGVRVYGDSGEIHWFKQPTPSAAAWMMVWLPGLEAGATYIGQIRCFTGPIPSSQYHVALKVVYPNRFETSYIAVTTSTFVVPFAFIAVPPLTGITPNVQFFPQYLSHCVIYDVHIKKV